MTQQDAGLILAIAAMAASSDGQQDAEELAQLSQVAERLGLESTSNQVRQAAAGQLDLGLLTAQLSDSEARSTAYDVSVAVCNANGPANERESAFLAALSQKLGLDSPATEFAAQAAELSRTTFDAPMSSSATLSSLANADAAPVAAAGAAAFVTTPSSRGPVPNVGDLDELILDQAMLTAALELLPDRLANIAILPLQLRLVYTIGQRHGQQLNTHQVKDLAATFGIGAVAQIMEGVVRKALGGIAGGLLGGLLGGATGLAAGASVTFASTYALGHAAEQYYAQGRQLSASDMKALFARFKGDASTMYPKVQDRVQTLAGRTNLQSVLRSIRG